MHQRGYTSLRKLVIVSTIIMATLVLASLRGSLARQSTVAHHVNAPVTRTVLRQPAARVQRNKRANCFFSSATVDFKVITKPELVKKMNAGEIILFDVREPNEVEQTGSLKSESGEALNLPLGFIESGAFDEDAERFEDNYGFPKPEHTDAIAFSCRSGVRSTTASCFALKAGYKNVYNYKGSALDWFA